MRGLDSRTNPDVAVIIPSTGRPEQCARLVDRIYETTRAPVKIVVSVELDDIKPYARVLAGLAVVRRAEPRLYTMTWHKGANATPASHVAAINRAAVSALAVSCPNDTDGDGNCWQCARRPGAHDPKLIIKLDDDHWPKTPGWDALYLNALERLGGTGVVYGNDLHQGERLPTVPGLSADIVRELGWYAPPQLGHLFCDNFWLELGRRSGRLSYMPHVLIEHRHPDAGKASNDAVYAAGGQSPDRWAADQATWHAMLAAQQAYRNGEPGRPWPSQMDQWASKVAGLAERGSSR